MKKLPFSMVFFGIFLTSAGIAILIALLAYSPLIQEHGTICLAVWAINTIIGISSLLLSILLPNKRFQPELIVQNHSPDYIYDPSRQ